MKCSENILYQTEPCLCMQIPIHLVGSTPEKKSVSRQKHVTKPSDGEPQKILQLANPRADLKALHQLATTFGLSKLTKE